MARGGQWEVASARTVRHEGSNTDHEGVGGITTPFLLQRSTVNTQFSHHTPARLYSLKNNHLVC